MRKVRLLALSIAGVLALPVLAAADPAGTGTTAASSSTASDPDQIVCRAGEPTTGTRIPGSRVCHTQREWDELQRQSQEALERMQSNGLMNSPPGH